MSYSEGMGIEIPKWVITTQTNKKFFNPKQNEFAGKLVEQCVFDSPEEADSILKQLDFGYVVKSARLYLDAENTRIWMV